MDARAMQASASASARNPTWPGPMLRGALPAPGNRRQLARPDRCGGRKAGLSSLAPAEGAISSLAPAGSSSAVAVPPSVHPVGSAAGSNGHSMPRRESAQIVSAAPKGAVKPVAVRVRFIVPEFVTAPGQQLVLIGSVPGLGCWDPEKAARMTWHDNHRWTAEVELEPGWHGAMEFKVALNERDHWSWEPGGNRLLVVERPRPQRATSPPRPLLQPAAEPSMAADGTALNGSSSSSNGNGVSAERTGRVAAAAAPVLEVVCEWGRAEAPSPALPASLQCGPLPGVLANGARVSALGAGAGVGLGGEAGGAPLIMANCQVVVPLFGTSSGPALCAGPLSSCSDQGSRDQGRSSGYSGSSSGSSSGDEGGGGTGPVVSTEREHLVLVGSVPALGCWDPAQGLRLACDEGGMWRGRLELPMGFSVHAKLVVMDSASNTPRLWEQGPNRVIRFPDPPPGMLQACQRGDCSIAGFGGGAGGPVACGTHAAAHHAASNGVHYGASNGATAAGASGSAAAAMTSSQLPAPTWHVMDDGEFMLVAHWGLPAFPQLLFLPTVEPSTSSRAASHHHHGHHHQHHAQRPHAVPCRFTVPQLVTRPGQQLLLVGSCPGLGEWDPTRGLRLRWGPGHTWHAAAALPADAQVEAKLVLWDGGTFRWEGGPNRRLRPGELVSASVPRGAWGEVAFMLYWGAAARSSVPGHTPAVVIPRDGPHPDEQAGAEGGQGEGANPASLPLHIASPSALLALAAAALGGRPGTMPGIAAAAGSSSSPAPAGAAAGEAGGSSSAGVLGADALMLRLVQFLASLQGVLPAVADAAGLLSPPSGTAFANGAGNGGGGGNGNGAVMNGNGAAAVANASRLVALEAQVDAVQAAHRDATLGWQREMDALKAQLAQSALALAAEEDEVEALHAALGAKHAELQALRMALANAEATASAAVAAATTALASTGVHFSGAGAGAGSSNGNGNGAHEGALRADGGPVASTDGEGLGTLATAMFQALTDQLAARQLEVDTLRRAAADAAAARTAEVAHLRVELSEAVAARHREGEAARVATASAALVRQQEVSGLMGQLTELQAARERDTAALQARVDSVLAAGAQETSRLSRQLAQACAAVEALDAQLTQERLTNAGAAATAAGEISRLRTALAARDQELDAARAAAADASAAAVGSMAAARAGCGGGDCGAVAAAVAAAEAARHAAAAAACDADSTTGLAGGSGKRGAADGGDGEVGRLKAELVTARAEAASRAEAAAALRVQLDAAAAETRALQAALQAASSTSAIVGLATQAAGPSPTLQGASQQQSQQQQGVGAQGQANGSSLPGIACGEAGAEASATEQLRSHLRATIRGPRGHKSGPSRNGTSPAGNGNGAGEGASSGSSSGRVGSLFRRLSGRGSQGSGEAKTGNAAGADSAPFGNNIVSLGGSATSQGTQGGVGGAGGAEGGGSSGNGNGNGRHAGEEEEEGRE